MGAGSYALCNIMYPEYVPNIVHLGNIRFATGMCSKYSAPWGHQGMCSKYSAPWEHQVYNGNVFQIWCTLGTSGNVNIVHLGNIRECVPNIMHLGNIRECKECKHSAPWGHQVYSGDLRIQRLVSRGRGHLRNTAASLSIPLLEHIV